MPKIYKYVNNSEKDKILELISESYGEGKKQKIIKQWTWRYENHPFITKQFNPFFVCEKNGKFICSMSFLPCKFKVNNICIRMSNVIDLMTHPAHISAGIRLLKESLEREPALIGTPNPRSGQLWQRLTPYDVNICKIFQFSYPINLGNIIYSKTRKKFTRYIPTLKNYYNIVCNNNHKLDFVHIKEFNEDYDKFFDKAVMDYKIIPIRNSKYLNWRFRDCPTENYDIFLAKKKEEIKGYTIIKFIKSKDGLNKARVVEIFAGYNDKDTYSFMVDNAIKYSMQKYADIIQFISTKNIPVLMKYLRQKLFFLCKESIISDVLAYTTLPEIDNNHFYSSAHDFHFTYGDFDQDLLNY